MSNILFFIKTLIITLLLAVLMQAHIGKTTIEAHIMGWVTNSSMTKPLQKVAEGGSKLIRDSWYQVKSLVESKIKTQKTDKTKKTPSQQRLKFQLQRSKAFLREQAQKTKNIEETKKETRRQVNRAWDDTERQGLQSQPDP